MTSPAATFSPPTARKTFLQIIGGFVPTVAVLGTLFALAMYGHHTKWRVGGHAEETVSPRENRREIIGASASSTGDVPECCVSGSMPRGSGDGRQELTITNSLQSDNSLSGRMAIVEFPSAASAVNAGIRTAPAEERILSEEVVVAGCVAYDQNLVASLSTRVPGTAWRIEKRVGDQIKAGEILAIIESSEVGKLKGAFLQARAELELQLKLLEISKSTSDVIARREMKEREGLVGTARIDLYNAQQALINLGMPIQGNDLDGLSPEQAFRKLQFLGLPESVVRSLDPAHSTANLLPIKAPFDGIVIGRDATIGEVVSPDKSQFVIVDDRYANVHLDVRKENAMRVQYGQTIVFRPDGADREVSGKIDWISTDSDAKTRTITVRVRVENPVIDDAGQRLLRANSLGVGRILVRESPKAVVAPLSAVQWNGSCHLLFVRINEQSFEARRVQAAFVNESTVEVLRGLSSGEQIVTSGGPMLRDEILKRGAAVVVP